MPWFRIGIAALIFASVSFLYLRYEYVMAENQRLSEELKTANANVVALDGLLKANAQIQKHERELVDEIEKAPPEHDAPTAIVLRTAIERLR